jgi:hypothetical protein
MLETLYNAEEDAISLLINGGREVALYDLFSHTYYLFISFTRSFSLGD